MAQGPGWIHRRWGWVLKGSVDVDARRRAKGRGVGPSPEAGARLTLTSRRARSLCARALSSHQPLLSTSDFIIVIVITLPCHSSGPLPLQLPVTWHVLAPLLLQSKVSSKASGPQSSLPSSGLLYPPFHGFP